MRKGWQKVTLGSIAKLLKERNGKEQFDRVMTMSASHGLIDQAKYFKKSVASANLSNYRVVRKGDFVYNKSTSRDAPMGVIVRWEDEDPILVSPIYLVFRVSEGQGNINYLSHYFRSILFFSSLKGLLREGARAHGALNVRQEEFLGAELVLPPLHEQQRIVDLMDSVDTAISTAQTELDAAVGLGARVLEHRLRTPGEGWQQTELGKLLEVKGGKRLPKGNMLQQEDNGAPYVRLTDWKNGSIETDGMLFVPDNLHASIQQYKCHEGDVLVSIVGSIGMVAVVPPSLNGAFMTENAAKLVCDESALSPEFLAAFLSSRTAQAEIVKKTIGSIQKKLALFRIKSIPINLPPIAEQQRIVDTMTTLNTAVSTAQTALDRLRDLRAAMLTVLLSGEHKISETYDQFLSESVEVQTG